MSINSEILVQVRNVADRLIERLVTRFRRRNRRSSTLVQYQFLGQTQPSAETLPRRRDGPLTTFLFRPSPDYPLNHRVYFEEGEKFWTGTIAWTGLVNNVDYVILELDDDYYHGEATDGTFHGQKLIVSEDHANRFILRSIDCLSSIGIFTDGDCCTIDEKYRDCHRECPQKCFLYRLENKGEWEVYPVESTFESVEDIKLWKVPDYALVKVCPPLVEEVCDYVKPAHEHQADLFVGRNKGIQGGHNSCYLDTLLFALFAFSDVMDEYLHEAQCAVAKSTFVRSIVYPLRSYRFVSENHVTDLRRLLAQSTGKPEFTFDPRDIPETMKALFESFLKIKPPTTIGYHNNEDIYYDTVFLTETIPCDRIQVPSSQQLLELSSLEMSFTLKDVPKFMVLQLTRCPNVNVRRSPLIPSLVIDLSCLIASQVKECCKCRRIATRQIEYSCVISLANTFFCDDCVPKAAESNRKVRPLTKYLMPDGNEPDTKLFLAALICIDDHHYTCFVRAGGYDCDRWLYFDSMREMEAVFDGAYQENIRIPRVELVPDFSNWITKANRFATQGNFLNNFYESIRDCDLAHVRRIFTCSCNAIYCSYPI